VVQQPGGQTDKDATKQNHQTFDAVTTWILRDNLNPINNRCTTTSNDKKLCNKMMVTSLANSRNKRTKKMAGKKKWLQMSENVNATCQNKEKSSGINI
jgi:hypothetical protein